MKKKYVLLAVLLIAVGLSACGSEPVETVTRSTVTAHLSVNLLSGVSIDLGTEMVDVEKHHTQTIDRLTGEVVKEDCYLRFPGEIVDSLHSSDLSKITLNEKAWEIEKKAQSVLDSLGGGPFNFTSSSAEISGSCKTADVYANVHLSIGYDEQIGGFLQEFYRNGHEFAYVYIPISFYDHILEAVANNASVDWSTYTYPTITEVGGYTVLPDDPNGVGSWLGSQIPFLEKVYFRTTELTLSQGVLEYTTTSTTTRVTGSDCKDRNWSNYGSCSDWGPITESRRESTDHEVDVVIGILNLK